MNKKIDISNWGDFHLGKILKKNGSSEGIARYSHIVCIKGQKYM